MMCAPQAALYPNPGLVTHPPTPQPSREKYEELKTKERELAAFMDAFPAERSARADQLEALQEGVTAALERLSKLSAISGGAMPSKGQFQEMQVGWGCEVLHQGTEHVVGLKCCWCVGRAWGKGACCHSRGCADEVLQRKCF